MQLFSGNLFGDSPWSRQVHSRVVCQILKIAGLNAKQTNYGDSDV